MTTLTIGKLASSCSVNIDTIRYYERKNLLNPVGRTETGYRLYSNESISRLHFIRTAQTLGFTLKGISELLAFQLGNSDCGDVQQKAQEQIQNIDDKINHLLSMKKALSELTESFPGEGNPINECPILNALSSDQSK